MLCLKEARKFAFLAIIISFTDPSPVTIWHSLTQALSKTPNILINALFHGCSRALMIVLFRGIASTPYSKEGRDIDDIKFNDTIGLLIFPSCEYIALKLE